MSDDLLLGIDVGTTNCKAIVFDARGRQRGGGSVPTPTRTPQPNRAEYDPEELWQVTVAAIRQALAGVDATHIRGVAVASMGEAGVLVDAAGQPLCPIIAWYDSRTLPQHAWWLAQIGAQRTFDITAVQPEPIYSALKLLWLRDNAPAAYRAATRWLHVGDYIAFRLGGAPATDYSLASRTMLLDLAGRRWSEALLDRAGLRAALLPELVPSGTLLGGVSAAAAAATGLPAGAAIGAGGHDHVVGALAAGVSAPGSCLDSMGTSEAALLTLDTLDLAKLTPGSCSFGAHVARDRWYALGEMWSSGAAVQWAAGVLALAQPEQARHSAMVTAAARVPPGSGGVCFLPRLAGGDRGAFVGLTGGTDAATMARAVYEGVAYEWRRTLEAMEALLATRASTIRVIGGGTRVPLWTQIKADVLGRPLHILDVDESVALGAALLAGIASGVYRDEADALAQLRLSARTLPPDAARAAFYERSYHAVYLPIAPALAQLHAAADALAAGE